MATLMTNGAFRLNGRVSYEVCTRRLSKMRHQRKSSRQSAFDNKENKLAFLLRSNYDLLRAIFMRSSSFCIRCLWVAQLETIISIVPFAHALVSFFTCDVHRYASHSTQCAEKIINYYYYFFDYCGELLRSEFVLLCGQKCFGGRRVRVVFVNGCRIVVRNMRFGAVCPFDYSLTTAGFPCARVLTEGMNFFEWIEKLHSTNQTERQNKRPLSSHPPTQRPKNRMFTGSPFASAIGSDCAD